MKRTFRFLTMGLLAVGLLASCNKKENNNGTANDEGFKAITEQGGGNSKTYGVLTSDTQLEVRWKAGDQIKVSNGSETCTFQLTSGEDQTSGEFNRLSGTTFDYTTGDFTAIYPVVNTEGVENTVGASTATFNLPATQTFDTEHPGSFAEKAMPMMAHATEQTLYFKNVLGGVCFPLVGNGLHVTKVVLTSSSTTDMLWGVFNANYTNDEPTLTYVSGGSNSITLNCDVTLDATNATEFTVMVPPGTLAAGFTVAAYDGEIKIYEKSTQTAPGADFIPRNTIRVVNNDLNVVISGLTVTTVSPTFISTTSAYGIGKVEVNSKEVKPITERGICWALASETTTPTLDNHYIAENQTTAGTYGVTIDGLTKDMVYYVRAYAKNTLGEVIYGAPIPFATRKDYANDYTGKIPYQFTVSTSKKVYFSMGNLQYIGSAATPYWKFADYQYVSFGDAQANDAVNIDRDLFGWGTSGYHDSSDGYNFYYMPYSVSDQFLPSFDQYGTHASGLQMYNAFGYGPSTNMTDRNLVGTSANYDWGVYNAISNGGNAPGQWRTLTGRSTGEWNYLLTNTASPRDQYRYAQVQLTINGTATQTINVVNGVPACGNAVNGLIVFCDSYEWPSQVSELGYLNMGTNFTNNMLTEAQWSLLEKYGAVFLPTTGFRLYGTDITGADTSGYYWSTSYNNHTLSHRLCFNNGQLYPNDTNGRYYGFSVRLVQEY